MAGRKTVTTTHGRYAVDGRASEKTIKMMAMPYERLVSVHDAETGRLIGDEEAVETPQRGDTILITDYERIMPRGEGHIAVVRLAELRGTTPVDECLYETSVVIGDRPFLRMVAESAIYYARDRGIRRVMVANGDVWEVIEAGGIDTTGVEMVRDQSPPAAGDNLLVTDSSPTLTGATPWVTNSWRRCGSASDTDICRPTTDTPRRWSCRGTARPCGRRSGVRSTTPGTEACGCVSTTGT